MNIIQKIEERVMELQAKGITPEVVYLTKEDRVEFYNLLISTPNLGGNAIGYLSINDMVLDVQPITKININSSQLSTPEYKSRLEVPIKRLQGSSELISPGSVHLLHEEVDITGIV